MPDDVAMGHSWTFDAELSRWEGPSAWVFLSLPTDIADEVADLAEAMPRAGFGSVRVEVQIGASTWQTSLFPDRSRGTYLLFVKKAVRTAAGIDDGDVVRATVAAIDL